MPHAHIKTLRKALEAGEITPDQIKQVTSCYIKPGRRGIFIGLYVPPKLKVKLTEIASKQKITLSSLVLTFITKGLAHKTSNARKLSRLRQPLDSSKL